MSETLRIGRLALPDCIGRALRPSSVVVRTIDVEDLLYVYVRIINLFLRNC